MKEYLKNNSRLLTICITLFAIAIAGFSFAYALEENQLYTRDELSNLVSELKEKEDSRFTVYETSTIINSSLASDSYTKGCELIINEPGNYLVFGYANSIISDKNGEFDCIFIGTEYDVWNIHDSSEIDLYKYCRQTSYIKVSSPKTFYLNLWQRSSSAQTLSTCIIKAVKI